jgi:hypothetical protein
MDELVPALKDIWRAMRDAAIEMAAFLEWLFTGGALCNIKAEDWDRALGNAFSWGGFSGIDATVPDFESITNSIMCILCSTNWLMFEYVWPLWNLCGAVIGMIVEKCKVLGGVNPTMEFCFALDWAIEPPNVLIVKEYSFSVGWALAVSAYFEKACYVFTCIGTKWTIPFPTLGSTGDMTVAGFSFNICLCGAPTKDGFVNMWQVSGKLYVINPKTMMSATIKMACGFFYVNYWFKFNAISVKVSAVIAEAKIKSPIECAVGLATYKVWVPFCVMARDTVSCRMYYTGVEFNIGNQWANYENSGGASHGHYGGNDGDGSMKGFQGYE